MYTIFTGMMMMISGRQSSSLCGHVNWEEHPGWICYYRTGGAVILYFYYKYVL